MYSCPVCGYPELPVPPSDYEICPSCGTEFEYHDARRSHAQLRGEWIQSGAHWHSRVVSPPLGWNPWIQLIRANFTGDVPRFVEKIREDDSISHSDVRERNQTPWKDVPKELCLS